MVSGGSLPPRMGMVVGEPTPTMCSMDDIVAMSRSAVTAIAVNLSESQETISRRILSCAPHPWRPLYCAEANRSTRISHIVAHTKNQPTLPSTL